MAATHTPHDDKIQWHQVGDPLQGGVSPLGEYVVIKKITLKRHDGSSEVVPTSSLSGLHVYHACVDHNKRVLGI